MRKIKFHISFLNRDINLLLLGSFVSKLGSSIFTVTLIWWLVNISGSSRYSGYALAVYIIPNIIIGPFSGVLVDRINKKHIIIVGDIICGSCSLLMFFLVKQNNTNIIILLFINAVLGIVNSIFEPAIRSLIPSLSDQNNISKTNLGFALNGSIAKIIGPLVSGFILVSFTNGIQIVFLLNSISYFFSAITETFIRCKSETYINIRGKINSSELFGGFSYIYNNREIFKVLIAATLANIFLGCFIILIPLYISNILNKSSTLYTGIVSMEALGGIIICIFSLIQKNSTVTTGKMKIYIVALGIIILIIPVSIFFVPILLVIAFLYGALTVIFDNTYISYLQINVDKSFLGRVFTVVFSLASIGTSIAYLIYGILGDYLLKNIFIVSGLSIIACAFIIKTKKDLIMK